MKSKRQKVVLAIDPGNQKCGMALIERDADHNLRLLWNSISPTESLKEKIAEANAIKPFSLFIVGSGTNSRLVVNAIREFMPSTGILLVDEKNTSLNARERYWECNPRKGWRRLLPATLQTPPVPIDDYVALILAERVLAED